MQNPRRIHTHYLANALDLTGLLHGFTRKLLLLGEVGVDVILGGRVREPKLGRLGLRIAPLLFDIAPQLFDGVRHLRHVLLASLFAKYKENMRASKACLKEDESSH